MEYSYLELIQIAIITAVIIIYGLGLLYCLIAFMSTPPQEYANRREQWNAFFCCFIWPYLLYLSDKH